MGLHEHDFETPLSLHTGGFHRIKFTDPVGLGHLNLLVFNQIGKGIVAGESYVLEGGGASYSGSTDATGRIKHLKVLAGYYDLKMGEGTYSVPTMGVEEEIHAVYVVVEPPPGNGSEEDEAALAEYFELLDEDEIASILALEEALDEESEEE